MAGIVPSAGTVRVALGHGDDTRAARRPGADVSSRPAISSRAGVAYIVALGSITIGALGLRLHALDYESLWMDELVTVESYALPLWEIVPMAAELGQPPLENFIGAALYRLGLGNTDWWVRLPSVAFGAGGVLLLGMWIGRIWSQAAGLAAAVLLAVCPLHVVMSQEARPYAMCFFFAIATVALFERAWTRNTKSSWAMFGTACLCLLMTRWTDPHFVVLGLLIYTASHMVKSRRGADYNSYDGRFKALWASVCAAYLVYAPVFIIILQHSPKAVGGNGQSLGRLVGRQLSETFVACLSGYSTRTVFQSLPANPYVVALGLGAFAIGLGWLITRLWRVSCEPLKIFFATMVPFPVLYALVYAGLGNAIPKPQYLLVGAIAAFGCIAIGLDGIRIHLARLHRHSGWVGFLVVLSFLALPMARASAGRLAATDKRDWRGVMTHLRVHSQADDAFAVIASDTIPSSFYPSAFGRSWYGLGEVKFLGIGPNTRPADLSQANWRSTSNAVWVLVYTDRMYTGADQIVPPELPTARGVIHSFNGLFLMEMRGDNAASDRLLAAIRILYEHNAAGRSMVWPGVLRARCLYDRGDVLDATQAFGNALEQCANQSEAACLKEMYGSLLGSAR